MVGISPLTIEDAVFEDNHGLEGGAVAIRNDGNDPVAIRDSTFGAEDVALDANTFEENTASGRGGGAALALCGEATGCRRSRRSTGPRYSGSMRSWAICSPEPWSSTSKIPVMLASKATFTVSPAGRST